MKDDLPERVLHLLRAAARAGNLSPAGADHANICLSQSKGMGSDLHPAFPRTARTSNHPFAMTGLTADFFHHSYTLYF